MNKKAFLVKATRMYRELMPFLDPTAIQDLAENAWRSETIKQNINTTYIPNVEPEEEVTIDIEHEEILEIEPLKFTLTLREPDLKLPISGIEYRINSINLLEVVTESTITKNKKLVLNPNGLENIFINIPFGNMNSTISEQQIYPMYSDMELLNISKSEGNLGMIVKIMNKYHKNDFDVKIFYKNVGYLCTINSVEVTYKVTDIDIINTEGFKHTIKELFFKISFDKLFKVSSILGNKFTFSTREWHNRKYKHSHVSSGTGWQNVCFGSSDCDTYYTRVQRKFNEDNFNGFIISLFSFYTYESSTTSPYRRISELYTTENVNIESQSFTDTSKKRMFRRFFNTIKETPNDFINLNITNTGIIIKLKSTVHDLNLRRITSGTSSAIVTFDLANNIFVTGENSKFTDIPSTHNIDSGETFKGENILYNIYIEEALQKQPEITLVKRLHPNLITYFQNQLNLIINEKYIEHVVTIRKTNLENTREVLEGHRVLTE